MEPDQRGVQADKKMESDQRVVQADQRRMEPDQR